MQITFSVYHPLCIHALATGTCWQHRTTAGAQMLLEQAAACFIIVKLGSCHGTGIDLQDIEFIAADQQINTVQAAQLPFPCQAADQQSKFALQPVTDSLL